MNKTNIAALGCAAAAFVGIGNIACGQAPVLTSYPTIGAYIAGLNASTDPQAVVVRQEIANGPADLAREKADCVRHNIPLTSDTTAFQSDGNAYPLFKQWTELRKNQIPTIPEYFESMGPRYSYTPDQLASVTKIFTDNPKVFDLMRQAASKPYCVSPPNDISVFAMQREAARELRAESYLLAVNGKYSDAITTESLSFDIARQSSTHSNIIGFLVGGAVEGLSLQGLQDILSIAGPNQAVDEQVSDALRKEIPVLSLKQSLMGEIPSFLTQFDAMFAAGPTGIESALEQSTGSTTASPTQPELTPDDRQFMSNLCAASEAQYLAHKIVLIDATELAPAPRRVIFSGLAAQGDGLKAGPTGQPDPRTMILTSVSMDGSQLDSIDNRYKAREQITLAAAAVLAAKAKTGAFPETLPGSFLDPFTGNPLGYILNGQTGFTIYSVGQTGKYDGKTADNKEAYFTYPAPTPVPSDTQ